MAFGAHEPGLSQDAQMVRDGGLRHIQLSHNIIHAQLFAAADLHNLLASFISQRLSKLNGIYRLGFHIDNYLYVIILIIFDLSREKPFLFIIS